ncbi:MFS transporter [Trichocoleus sp. FACHB-591]|uniref:MFS transporter n=1 Tax=Trichocoleus sp. FACHB-591 TaxID=2692872 RepID=UPI0016841DEA|nr:MFS transporter [Trichocoleus sp. FACHB-591]MBD2097003.1 MFS transporter [Trichocoleus sp. FACHB-591]
MQLNGLQKIWFQVSQQLPALRSRNFRLYFIGQSFSLSGTFMTQVAVPWVIYDLTHSAWLLGLTGFLGFLPTLILTPFSGVLSDRWSRRSLLLLAQFMGIAVSFALTILTFLKLASFESLLMLSILAGVVKGLDMPVRHAFVVEMVNEREDLSNAIALNSAMLSSSRLIGPAIGGILLATVGAGYCFLYDSLSYVAAILALWAMRLTPQPIEAQTSNNWQRLKEGFRYVYTFLPIRSILLLLTVQGLFGIAYMALLPIFAADILQGGPETMGFLTAAGAIGSVFACVYLSLRRGTEGLERLIALCPAVIGLGLIAFSQSRVVWISLLLLVLVGSSSTLQVASSNTVIQSLVEDSKRGRVMSFYALSLVGMLPLSNLLAGSLAQAIGAPSTLVVCGSICILGSLWFSQQLPAVSRWIQQELH